MRAKERDPERRVVLLEASRIAWAASGRNGGFCESSLTHGHENGVNRWPEEIDRLEELGHANLDGIGETIQRYGMDAEFERTGQLAVAVEPHQVEWFRDEPGFLDREAVQAEVHSDTFLAGDWDRDGCAMVHPAKLGVELARVGRRPGGGDLRAQPGARDRGRRIGADHPGHPERQGGRRCRGPRYERVPLAPQAQPPDDRAGTTTC